MSGMEIIKKGTDLVYVLPTFQNFLDNSSNTQIDKTITELSILNNSQDISFAKLTGRQNTYIIKHHLEDLKHMGFKTAVLFSHGAILDLKFKEIIDNFTTQHNWHILGGFNYPISIINLERIEDFQVLDNDDAKETFDNLLDQIYYNAMNSDMIELPIPHDIRCHIGIFDTKEFIERQKASNIYLSDTDGLLPPLPPGMDIETLICPASGINQYIMASYSIDTLKKIIWVDFSTTSINWIQYVIDNWNGSDYKKFVKDNIHKIQDGMITFLDYDYFDNMPDLDWEKFKSLEHVFLNIDLINEYSDIIKHTKDSNVLVHITNIYTYELNYIENGVNQVYISYLTYLDKLIERNKNVYIKGKDPFGTSIKYKNISKYGIL